MTYDTDFLADVPYLEENLGICLRSNPFYASVLVNGSSAKDSKGKSRDYDRDADDPAVALYTIDPLTNGGDVQIKLKIQRACRVLHHELLRMRSRTHQKQQQNQQETDSGIDDPSSPAPPFSAFAAGIPCMHVGIPTILQALCLPTSFNLAWTMPSTDRLQRQQG